VRAANIITAIAMVLWFGLVLVGHDLTAGVARRMGGNVSIIQLDYYVLWPSWVVAALLLAAWVCNIFRRGYWFLGSIAGVSLAGLLPFLASYGGGM
jgi:hypothetical protein